MREAVATRSRRGPAGLHRARARRLCAAARALRPRRRRGRGPRAARRRPSPTARRSTPTSAGSRAQGGDPDEAALPVAPVVRDGRRRERGGYVAARSARSRSASPRSTSAPAGGRRTTRSTTRSASSASRSAATGRGRASRSPRSTRATRRRRADGRRRGAAPRTSSATSPAGRGRSCSRSLGRARPCPSCPRSRPCAAGSRRALEGRTLRARRDRRPAADAAHDPDAVAAELEGERVAAVERRGKYLIVRFESGRALLVHLRMTGSFRHAPGGSLDGRSAPSGCCQTRRRVGRRLPRRAPLRHVAAARAGRASTRTSPRALGPEPLGARLHGAARSPRGSPGGGRRVKAALLDQRTVAGLGNIYADEALWRARHPSAAGRPASSTPTRSPALHRASARRSSSGSRRQGATLRDYRRPTASGRDAGRVQGLRPRRRAVRPRAGRRSSKTRVGGRGTWFCPACQPLRARQCAVGAAL